MNIRIKYLLRRFIAILSFVIIVTGDAKAQENVTTLGIQVKPMIPSRFLNTGPTSAERENLSVNLTPKLGWNFGMMIRRGITKMWSFETGINLVQRNYNLTFNSTELPETAELNFRLIGYEIPVQGLIYVQLGKQLWMNVSGGVSLDLYPSNIQSSDFIRRDSVTYDFYQKTFRNGWLQTSVLANIGFEWRTKKDGYFYLGTSYHRPFRYMGFVSAEFTPNNLATQRIEFPVSGNYLTADLRYFFHENPERKKSTKTKKAPK